jgi:hypothetical protein
MKVVLFTNARDEHRIREWVVHHRHLGFDQIYISDHISKTRISDVVDDIPNVHVQCIETVNKNDLIQKAILRAAREDYDWMLYLDADEFLILPNHDHVHAFLEEYHEFDQIGMNWLLFGSNHHHDEPSTSMLASYTRCQNHFDVHIKSFVRPTTVKTFANPHCYYTIDMSKSVGVDRRPLDLQHPHWFNNSLTIDSPKLNAYIAHYIFQSYKTYHHRKVGRTRDDNNSHWEWSLTEETIHLQYNDRENNLPRDRYNEKNLLQEKKRDNNI